MFSSTYPQRFYINVKRPGKICPIVFQHIHDVQVFMTSLDQVFVTSFFRMKWQPLPDGLDLELFLRVVEEVGGRVTGCSHVEALQPLVGWHPASVPSEPPHHRGRRRCHAPVLRPGVPGRQHDRHRPRTQSQCHKRALVSTQLFVSTYSSTYTN